VNFVRVDTFLMINLKNVCVKYKIAKKLMDKVSVKNARLTITYTKMIV